MNKTDERILYLIIGVLFINLFITVWENMENIGLISVLTCIMVGLIIYNELFLAKNKEKIIYFSFITLLIIVVITWINIYGSGVSIRNFYFIILYQIFRTYSKYIAISIYLFISTLHIIINTISLHNTKLVINIITSEAGIFLLIMVIIMLIISMIDQNNKLETMRTELTLNNLDIEHTHSNLIKAYNQLEILTIIQERNKIARDMHDTVGHTLTTALIELEVGKVLLNEQKEEAQKKFSGAIELVRKGLYDLRTSVKTLKDHIDYLKEIEGLIYNTISHTGVKIRYNLDKNIASLDQLILSCVYRILQEGITNGIKHGEASAFIFNLIINETGILIRLENNGKGTSVFNKGFGINAMEERIKELNGHIKFDYGYKMGFGIQVFIPL